MDNDLGLTRRHRQVLMRAMAHIVYVTSGLVGALGSGLEMARRLERDGHRVTIVGWRDLADQVGRSGFAFVRVNAADRFYEQHIEDAASTGKVRTVPSAFRMRRALNRSTEIEDSICSLSPDLLIVDIEVHTFIIAVSKLQIPLLLRNDFFPVFRDWDVPPLHTDLMPGTDLGARLRSRLAWSKVLAARALRFSVGELRPRRVLRAIRPYPLRTVQRTDLRQFARGRGVRLRELTDWTQWLSPHAYPSIPSVSTTASELDFARELPPGHSYVGPMIQHDRVDDRVTPDDRRAWDAFRDHHRTEGTPIVYCAFGSMLRGTERVFDKVIDASACRDWVLVVGLGGRNATEQRPQSTDRVLILDDAPQLEVLDVAEAAVIHGGINTVAECISRGVPMILDGFGTTDGAGNAARVEYHALGRRVDFATVSPAGLAAAIDEALHDPKWAERVGRMAEVFRRYESERELERLIRAALPPDDRSGTEV